MEAVLQELHGESCLIHLQDVIVLGRNFDELKQSLTSTLVLGQSFIVDTDESNLDWEESCRKYRMVMRESSYISVKF